MVDASQRRGLLPLKICAECFNLAIAQQNIYSYLDCNEPLIPFFEKMFFEVQNREKHHPSFGKVAIMRIDLRRRGNLRQKAIADRALFTPLVDNNQRL